MLFEHKNAYPDYDSCRKKCQETNDCKYFGVWNATILPTYCRGWDSCDRCIPAGHYNLVYKLESGKYPHFMKWIDVSNKTLLLLSSYFRWYAHLVNKIRTIFDLASTMDPQMTSETSTTFSTISTESKRWSV